jgi:hypothetical protein
MPKQIPAENFHQEVRKKGKFIKVQIIAENKIPEGFPGEGFHPWTFMDEMEINFK